MGAEAWAAGRELAGRDGRELSNCDRDVSSYNTRSHENNHRSSVRNFKRIFLFLFKEKTEINLNLFSCNKSLLIFHVFVHNWILQFAGKLTCQNFNMLNKMK